MSAEIEFVPYRLQIDCRAGKVVVGYTVSLENDEFQGMIGGSEGTEVMSKEIEETVKLLTEQVVHALRDRVGLNTKESSLDDPAKDFDDEDQL